jgi:hypothetical protein
MTSLGYGVDMADSFFSSALGQPYEYEANFIERVGLVSLAKMGRTGGDLKCRPQGDSGPYKDVRHNQKQVQQVLLDMDKAQLGG